MTKKWPPWEAGEEAGLIAAVSGWVRQGVDEDEICAHLGISRAAFLRWKRESPALRAACRTGKAVADGILLDSVFRQATGYYYPEEQVHRVREPAEEGGKVVPAERLEVVRVQRFAKPNAMLARFLLTNRLPEHFRERREAEGSGEPVQMALEFERQLREVVEEE